MLSKEHWRSGCLALVFGFISFSAAALADTKKKKESLPPPAPAVASWEARGPAGTPAIWSGIYAGLSAGYGWGESVQDYERNDNHGLASTSPSGALGSVTLGYNWMLDRNILLGAEADLGLMDVSADDKVVYDGHIYKTHFGPWWGTLRARAGWVAGDTLFYGTGGVAFMSVDEISIGNTPGETARNEDSRTGWVLGAGIEHAFAPGVTAKLEYLHMDFGRFNGLSDNAESYYFDNRVDLVRTGINFRF